MPLNCSVARRFALPPDDRMPNRTRGILLMLAAGVCWSLGGIIVKSLVVTDVWVIVFWRAFFMTAFLGVLLVALRGRSAVNTVRAVGMPGLIAAACLALQIYCFILALQNTTAANTFVLMSVSPLCAAVMGLLFLRERVAWHTWIAIAVALAGIVIMFGEGLGSGRWIGNVFALCIPLAFACQLLFIRKVPGATADLMPTVFLGGLIALTPALILGGSLAVGPQDFLLLALMGCVQLGLGCWLMTLAARHLRVAEMGLLALTETVLAPLWVWLGLGETPGVGALTGGLMIVAALVLNAALAMYAEFAERGRRHTR